MKKHFLTLIAFAIFTTISFAQVGINSDNSAPHPSAQLDVKSTDKGLLIPRLTTLERNAVQSPEIGLMVFDKDLQEIFIYNSDGWKQGTLSKLPLIINNTDKFFGLKVTSSYINPYPDVAVAAEFVTTGLNGGHAIRAKSAAGNSATIRAMNSTGNGIESTSFGSGYGGYFSSESGVSVGGFSKDNYFITGVNYSNTLPTAKFTNTGDGPAMELNGELNITVNKPIGLKIINNSNVNDGNNAAAYFIHNGSYGAGVISQVSSTNSSIIGMNFGSGIGISGISNNGYAGGSFSSQSGYGATIQSQTFIAATIYNNSITFPTVFIRNATGGMALEVDGNIKLSGKINQDPYQYPSLINGWQNYGDGYNQVRFYKDKENIVHLEGVLKSDDFNGGAFVLPEGYRPSARSVFTIQNANGWGRCDIHPNGQVGFLSGYFSFTSLDGVSFRVE